jgi:hypothetical protein
MTSGWQTELRALVSATLGVPASGLHLGVFVEPYLSWILEGRKTIESRFTRRRIAPFGVVDGGDWLVLKRSAGPIVAVCRITAATHFELRPTTLARIRDRYGAAMCAEDAEFWRSRAEMRYASLLHLGELRLLEPTKCAKQDRRGWVVLSRRGDDQ